MSTEKNKEEFLQKAANTAASSVIEKKPNVVMNLYDSFIWDGVEVTEIDLSGLYDMTAEDMLRVDEQMRIKGFSGMNPEVTRQYALLTAARINKKPWEWLSRMKARDAVRLRNVVAGFFFMPG